ncbi:MAG: ClbS/DfsB family four-helix bundle protein [Anaerolineaceae bacterium]|nr:ClbS/DfsB family four-helix bundle protein [Anaerolineaceae bacterium]
MNTKDKMIRMLKDTQSNLASFAEGLEESERIRVGTLENWSARDVFTHVTFWNQELVHTFDCIEKGTEARKFEDYNAENDRVQEEQKEKSWTSILSEFEATVETIFMKLETFSEEQLLDDQLVSWLQTKTLAANIIGTAIWHAEWHIAEFQIAHGDKDKAIKEYELFSGEVETLPGWEFNAPYNLACMYVRVGDNQAALSVLAKVFEKNAQLKEWAQKDGDLAALHDDPGFKALVQ